jgi:hypothetical protein
MWAWILMFTVNTGNIEIYAVYTDRSQCLAVAKTLPKTSVLKTECVGIDVDTGDSEIATVQ